VKKRENPKGWCLSILIQSLTSKNIHSCENLRSHYVLYKISLHMSGVIHLPYQQSLVRTTFLYIVYRKVSWFQYSESCLPTSAELPSRRFGTTPLKHSKHSEIYFGNCSKTQTILHREFIGTLRESILPFLVFISLFFLQHLKTLKCFWNNDNDRKCAGFLSGSTSRR